MRKSQSKPELQFNYTYLPPLAMAEKPHLPALEWIFLAGVQALRVFLNRLAVRLDKSLDDLVARLDKLEQNIQRDNHLTGLLSAVALLDELKDSLRSDVDLQADVKAIGESVITGNHEALMDGMGRFFSHLDDMVPPKPTEGHFSDIDDYKKMFRILPLPSIADCFEDDACFANMRVAGPNPLVIERYDEPKPNFPVTDVHFQNVMGKDDNLADAMRESRVFIADYAVFAGGVQGSFPDQQKNIWPHRLRCLPSPNKVVKSDA